MTESEKSRLKLLRDACAGVYQMNLNIISTICLELYVTRTEVYMKELKIEYKIYVPRCT